MQLLPKTMNPQPLASRLCRRRFRQKLAPELALSAFALLFVPPTLGVMNLPAQTPASHATNPTQPQEPTAKLAERRGVVAAQVDSADSTQHSAVSEAIAALPYSSSVPGWLDNQPPNPARVRWDNRGLEIEASNSSLDQILRRVAADTGARLEGLTHDQRVFGSYGPGPGCDVLSKLLDGSGYNVLMIGCRDSDAPLEIILSTRLPGSPKMAANSQTRNNSEDSKRLERELQHDDPSEPSSLQSNQDPFNIGGPPRDPSQVMQEILDRQHKIDQQQDQQNNPKH